MSSKDTLFSIKQTINCGGRIVDFSIPRVMGILNITPDSFFDGGYYLNEEQIHKRVADMLNEGADIIDLGAYSSRPGANDVTVDEEKSRLEKALKVIRYNFPKALISVDTFRASIAEFVIENFGPVIINDISAGMLDKDMISTVGSFQVPYIMMHMQGNPKSMQNNPVYQDVTKEVIAFFAGRIAVAIQAGIKDIIIDPGFGFGKTQIHNYKLLNELRLFQILGLPVLAGLSRKSMIFKPLDIFPFEALNGTTVLNTLALNNGAKMLRVHDVKEAVDAVRLYTLYTEAAN